MPHDDMAEETTTLTAQCYCKAVHFALDVPKSALPLKTHICHCSVCRYTHGTLCIFHAPLPAGVAPRFIAPSSLDALTGYAHAKAKGRRYFCSTCGCHIGDVGINDPNWVISTSIFDASKAEGGFRIGGHVMSKSAKDGGLANWLPSIAGRAMRDWNPSEEDEPEMCAVTECEAETGPDGEERLRARCHCGGVSFTIPRPTPAVAAHEVWKTYLSPVDPGRRWVGCVDLCDDCRLVAGAHVSAWTFVPRSLVMPALGEDLMLGASKTYASSEGVLRSFCGTCGATVFYSCDDRKEKPGGGDDQMLDISVGILRAPEGPLAEEWLTWRTGRAGWMESGKRYDAGLAESLAEGMKAWGNKKYGEALDFAIGTP